MMTTKNPHVSVVIAVYNTEKYLPQCIDSVLGQTFASFELIIVDDGSTDATPSICDDYASKNPHVTVVHQKNGGQTRARQAGVSRAKGEYVMVIDADDWLEPHALETLYSHASKANADIVTCNSYFHTLHRKTRVGQQVPTGTFKKDDLKKRIYPVMLYSGTFFYFGIFAAMWNKLFKKSILLPNLMNIDPAVRIGEDGLTSFGAFLDAKTVCIIEDHLYNYRNDNASLTRSYAKDQFDSTKLLIKSLRDLSARKGTYDLSRQIDYYYLYNVRSIFEEEFHYKTGRSLQQKWAYLAKIARDKDVRAAIANLDSAEMNHWNRIFLRLLQHQRVRSLFIATWLYIHAKKAKLALRRYMIYDTFWRQV